MKKTTTILIAIVFVASVAIISFFGMRIKVYNQIVPVTQIECLNKNDEQLNIRVKESNNTTIIQTRFTTPADVVSQSGTMIQLYWRVLPDDATTKDVMFVYDKTNTRATIFKNENGEETGLVLFYKPCILDVKIMSTDGRRIIKEITVAAYA